jgi:DNA repair protein RecO (recombination protein O)
MQWSDEGIVLGARRHGEANAILELMTRQHGRHLGLVYGGAGRRLRPILQAGNRVTAIWRARLDEHLGTYTVEGLELPAASFLAVSHAVYGVTHLGALCRLLPERDPHPLIHAALAEVLAHLLDPRRAGPDIVRFELNLLSELGFGLDLERCAATGTTSDLAYVSPKTGRAVSRETGRPWHDKLLRFPPFLAETGTDLPGCSADLADGFAMTGFFLLRYVLEPRGLALPEARSSFVNAVLHACANEHGQSSYIDVPSASNIATEPRTPEARTGSDDAMPTHGARGRSALGR